jgi:hypothetical protein
VTGDFTQLVIQRVIENFSALQGDALGFIFGSNAV